MSVENYGAGLDLKFRKILIQVRGKKKIYWVCLDRFLRQKITSYPSLNLGLQQFQEVTSDPIIRVYHMLSQFSNAKQLTTINRLDLHKNYPLRLWMCLESDYYLNYAQPWYQELYKALVRMDYDPQLVYSGDSSIHMWIPFDMEKYLNKKHKRIINRMQMRGNYPIKRMMWFDRAREIKDSLELETG